MSITALVYKIQNSINASLQQVNTWAILVQTFNYLVQLKFFALMYKCTYLTKLVLKFQEYRWRYDAFNKMSYWYSIEIQDGWYWRQTVIHLINVRAQPLLKLLQRKIKFRMFSKIGDSPPFRGYVCSGTLNCRNTIISVDDNVVTVNSLLQRQDPSCYIWLDKQRKSLQ